MSGSLLKLRPIIAQALGQQQQTFDYDSTRETDHGISAEGRVTLTDGTVLSVTDRITLSAFGIRMDRAWSIRKAGSSEGVRLGLEVHTEIPGTDETDWQYFISGTLYNRNDTDGDGQEDYLGTYVQDVRDDKNGVLAVLARHASTGLTVSLARLTKPSFDTAVNTQQLQARFFVQNTDIGSLGVAPIGSNIRLRASYPYCEENTFSLDTAGSGWAAFAPNREGTMSKSSTRSASWSRQTSRKASGNSSSISTTCCKRGDRSRR